MAINKVINKKTTSHGAMKNVISYVLRGDKVKEGCVDITGPYEHEVIDWDHVYRAFLHEKRLWDKDSGRMYAHNIISFHRDEAVTPDVCMRIGRTFADQFFPEHQNLISVHQDNDHLHIHIITNSVSFIDGRKLHQTKRDLERQKDFTNKLCEGLGLSVTEKGKHFDGSAMEEGLTDTMPISRQSSREQELLSRAQDTIRELTETVSSLQGQLETEKSRTREAMEKISTLSSQNSMLLSGAQEMRSTMEQLREELSSEQSLNQRIAKENNDLRNGQGLQTRESQDRLRHENADLKVENDELREQVNLSNVEAVKSAQRSREDLEKNYKTLIGLIDKNNRQKIALIYFKIPAAMREASGRTREGYTKA